MKQEPRTPAFTSLSVIVPVYNERYLVAESLNRLRVLGEDPQLGRIQALVVDDGSTDGSGDVLRGLEAERRQDPWPKFEWQFLYQQRNAGKGAALRAALEQASGELTVCHDADLEYHPRDLLKMIPLFREENADAVFGSRFAHGGFRRVLFYRHQLGNRLLTLLCNLVTDLNLTDMETCYKMVRTPLLKSIPLESSDFRIEPELVVKLARRHARIFEVPVSYSGRTYQEGKKINWKDGALALAAIVRHSLSDRTYREDPYGSQILERLSRARRFTAWMADTVRPFVGQRVLEIGAGTGNLTGHLIPRGAYWATDVNPLYLDQLRRLGDSKPYLRTAYTDLAQAATFPAQERFDTVICMNVLEHVPDDVAALQNIRHALEPGGRAIVLVPQGPRLFGTLDEVLGHCRRYTPASLRAAAENGGFHVARILEFNRASSPAWWFNGRVLRRRTFGLVQIKMMNLLVPLFRRLDSWLPLPGLSLIAILERPAHALQ